MTRLHRLCIVALMTVMLGCAPSVSRDHAKGLVSLSAALLAYPEGDIPESRWPASVVELKPKRVYRNDRGVYICTYAFFVEEYGVFILDPASSFVPSRDGDPSYDVIAPGVFIYRSAG